MRFFLKTLSLSLSCLLLIAASVVIYREYGSRWLSHPSFGWFLFVFVVSSICFWKCLSPASFYSTLRHELCHCFFALISFNKPAGLNVYTGGRGSYSYYGQSNYFITLSPYFFPLVSLMLLSVSLFFSKPSHFYFLLMGVVFAFETISMAKDYHPHQTDLQKYGRWFSFLFSVVMYLLFAFSLFVILFSGWSGYGIFLSSVFCTLLEVMY